MYSGGSEQYGQASARGDEEPSSIPREMRVEDGYGVIGRREGGPASSYWDLLIAHLSDPLTGMDDAMILSCGHSYGSSGMQHIYRIVCPRKLVANVVSRLLRTPFDQTWLFALQFRHLDARKSQQKH